MIAGYSGTRLAKKLGITEGMRVVDLDAPDIYSGLLGPRPPDWEIRYKRAGEADILRLFTNTRDGLFRGVSESRDLIKPDGAIWVSWYKKAAKLPTEITEDDIRAAALPLGLVDVKVCAVDEKWSGLKLVIRRENRI